MRTCLSERGKTLQSFFSLVTVLVIICISLGACSLTVLSSLSADEKHEHSEARPPYPYIQVAVITTHSIGKYWERFAANANGWHLQFPDILVYTFDRVEENSTLSRIYNQIDKVFESEPTTSSSRNNMQLATVGEMYRDNPNADYYIIVDDDTVLVPVNLRGMIRDLRLNPNNETMLGRCVGYDEVGDGRGYSFVVGGAGIFMSHALVKAMAPHIPKCRHEYTHVYHADARIGGCINYTMKHAEVLDDLCSERREDTLDSNSYMFTNGDVLEEMFNRPEQERVVTVHEKNPHRIDILNKWFLDATAVNATITWGAMKRSSLPDLLRAAPEAGEE